LTDARLLDRSWPAATNAILTQQLREPAEEKRLAAALPELTSLSASVSRAVAAQYEENPIRAGLWRGWPGAYRTWPPPTY
jgi:hypothetical protein